MASSNTVAALRAKMDESKLLLANAKKVAGDLDRIKGLGTKLKRLEVENEDLKAEYKELSAENQDLKVENERLREELAQATGTGPELQKENDALRRALREALTHALREALRDTASRLRFGNSASRIESAGELKKRFAILLRGSGAPA